MVGLLKQDVGSDFGFFQQAVVVNRSCSNVDIYAADGAVFMFNAVNGVDGVQIILHGVVKRVFAGFQGKPFVAHVLQGDYLPADIFLGKLLAGDMFVF